MPRKLIIMGLAGILWSLATLLLIVYLWGWTILAAGIFSVVAGRTLGVSISKLTEK